MYINTSTLEKVTESQIRTLFPYTSFPIPFSPPQGFAVLFAVPQPSYDPITQGIREGQPELTDNKWFQTWEIYDLDTETIARNTAAKLEQLQQEIVYNTQKRLDEFAKTRNYDSILSACTYATSTVTKFQTEGQYCVNARDLTWAKLYEILGEIEQGTRPTPAGYADIEPELPVLEWPN